MQSANLKNSSTKYAIIAGCGVLPKIVADALGEPFILSFGSDKNEFLDIDFVANMGQIGEIVAQLKAAKVQKILFAGSIKKPNLKDLRLDSAAAKLLGKAAISRVFGKLPGDDALFKLILGYLEKNGFEILGVHEVVPELLAEQGALGEVVPDAVAMADILRGCAEAKKLGEDDVGQAVVCAAGELVATEDVKGTDNLLERSTKLGAKKAVLVKCKKPQQDERIDLPSIGVQTIERIAALGFAGVAVEAEHSLVIEKDKVRVLADKLGVFVYGF